jgi:hypothetical protein
MKVLKFTNIPHTHDLGTGKKLEKEKACIGKIEIVSMRVPFKGEVVVSRCPNCGDGFRFVALETGVPSGPDFNFGANCRPGR